MLPLWKFSELPLPSYCNSLWDWVADVTEKCLHLDKFLSLILSGLPFLMVFYSIHKMERMSKHKGGRQQERNWRPNQSMKGSINVIPFKGLEKWHNRSGICFACGPPGSVPLSQIILQTPAETVLQCIAKICDGPQRIKHAKKKWFPFSNRLNWH